MHGFWRLLVRRYRELGGEFHAACRATLVMGAAGQFLVATTRGKFGANQVVSALPAATTAEVAAIDPVRRKLAHFIHRDATDQGGAIVVFLGVPEPAVAGRAFTHHQLMWDYARPLGDGNNMFISVSAGGDTDSAPAGRRAVMISTHTELAAWRGLDPIEYMHRKESIRDRLISYAKKVYPDLDGGADVIDIGTPLTYQRFAGRPGGAVGGARQHPSNTNQHAVPHSLGAKGFWLVGDSTWPGLGTVACVLGSRIVADGVRREARRWQGVRR
jgi:phytoene dehydrogenase-like protein